MLHAARLCLYWLALVLFLAIGALALGMVGGMAGLWLTEPMLCVDC